MAIRVGVRDLIRNSNILKEYDYVEIEDKKTHKLRGIFVSGKVAEDFKRFLEEEKQKKIQEKLDALNNIIEFAKSSRNYFLDKFDKNDTKILQKVKGMI
jgi:DNA mismatch repair ATPase MutS